MHGKDKIQLLHSANKISANFGLLAFAMPVKSCLLFLALSAIFNSASAQNLEIGAGIAYNMFLGPPKDPDQESSGSNEPAWDLNFRFTNWRKQASKGCLILHVSKFNANVHYYSSHNSSSFRLEARMRTIHMGLGWLPLHTGNDRLQIQGGFLLNTIVLDRSYGYWHKKEAWWGHYEDERVDFKNGNEKMMIFPDATFDLVASLDYSLMKNERFNCKIRFSALLNPIEEFWNMTSFKPSMNIVASIPLRSKWK